jgi:hypothetical protein
MALSLTAERLREVLEYAPETGLFYWKVQTSRRNPVGKVAGCICKNSGYRLIGIDGVVFKASRLAWFYVNGEWPDGIIDHINCDRLDDSWSNLRLATQAQNLWNRGPQANNPTGYKGVSSYNGGTRYCARIRVHGKVHRKNGFSTPAEAGAWYAKMAPKLHGEFARVA